MFEMLSIELCESASYSCNIEQYSLPQPSCLLAVMLISPVCVCVCPSVSALTMNNMLLDVSLRKKEGAIMFEMLSSVELCEAISCSCNIEQCSLPHPSRQKAVISIQQLNKTWISS